ncbi:hypothetical protein AMTR_s00050p00188180 [Amborella trichopoda]|uniref:Uncharacterized protein n=1 Tax=Amborella trichopoda TaxID=13333 RepID=W1PS99_AMBTC|nr:hypothetical protein AMTR_s00050p00188180 [Amborella trichopoda]
MEGLVECGPRGDRRREESHDDWAHDSVGAGGSRDNRRAVMGVRGRAGEHTALGAMKAHSDGRKGEKEHGDDGG